MYTTSNEQCREVRWQIVVIALTQTKGFQVALRREKRNTIESTDRKQPAFDKKNIFNDI